MPTPLLPPTESWRLWALAALAATLLSAFYFGSLADLPLDTHDQDYFTDSAQLSQNFSHLFSGQKLVTGRPAFELVLWLEYLAWGEDPRYFHLFGVFLHAAASLLLAYTGRRLGLELKLALLGGLLFLLNTAHFHAIHWISAHCYSLVLIYTLVASLNCLRYAETQKPIHLVWVYTTLVLGVLTQISAAVFLPFLLYLAWLRGYSLKPLLLRLLPLALLLPAMVYGLKALYPQAPQAAQLASKIQFSGLLSNFALCWSRLITTAHWLPLHLYEVHLWELLPGLLALVGGSIAIAKRFSPLAEWTAWIFLGLLPPLLLTPSYIATIPSGPSRYLYLSSAGSSLILAWALLALGTFLGLRHHLLKNLVPAGLVLVILITSFFSLKKVEAISYYTAARNYLSLGQTDAGVTYLQQALNQNNDTIDRQDTYTRLYLMMLAQGDDIGPHLAKARRAFPQNTNLLLFKDIATSLGPDSTMAQQALQRLAKHRGNRRSVQTIANGHFIASAYYNAGRGFNRRGDSQRATQAFQQALSFDPDNTKTRKELVNILTAAGQWQEVFPLLVQLGPQPDDRANPAYKDPKFLGRLATEYVKQNRPEEGSQYFDKAFSLDPNNYQLRYQAGKVYFRGRHYQHALDAFRQASTLAPKRAEAYVGLGNSFRGLEQLEQSRQAYQKAANLAPTKPMIYHNIGGVEAEMGNKQRALDAYRRAADLGSKNPSTYTALLNLLEQTSTPKAELDHYHHQLKQLSSSPPPP